MKLTKENYELLMFDLMEGNLPEQAGRELLRQIEEDPFFQAEWVMLNQTVLKPGEVKFPNKDGLLKPVGKTIIMPAWVRYTSYAAILVIGFLGFFRYFLRDGLRSGGEIEVTAIDGLGTDAKETTAPEQAEMPSTYTDPRGIRPMVASQGSSRESDDEVDSDNTEPNNPQYVASRTPEKTVVNPAFETPSSEEGLIRPEYAYEVIPAKQPEYVYTYTSEGDGFTPEYSNATRPQVEWSDNGFQLARAKNWIRTAANIGTNAIRNPSVRIARADRKENKGLDIHFKTDEYFASAFVELKR